MIIHFLWIPVALHQKPRKYVLLIILEIIKQKFQDSTKAIIQIIKATGTSHSTEIKQTISSFEERINDNYNKFHLHSFFNTSKENILIIIFFLRYLKTFKQHTEESNIRFHYFLFNFSFSNKFPYIVYYDSIKTYAILLHFYQIPLGPNYSMHKIINGFDILLKDSFRANVKKPLQLPEWIDIAPID